MKFEKVLKEWGAPVSTSSIADIYDFTKEMEKLKVKKGNIDSLIMIFNKEMDNKIIKQKVDALNLDNSDKIINIGKNIFK